MPSNREALTKKGKDTSDNSEARAVAYVLPLAALDARMAIVGTSGSGKTYAAKGMVGVSRTHPHERIAMGCGAV
jgi:ABC-type glutathione transport system ATPase component